MVNNHANDKVLKFKKTLAAERWLKDLEYGEFQPSDGVVVVTSFL